MIYIGKIVSQRPTYEGSQYQPPMQGRVIYIHPAGIYYVAEFDFGRGRTMREAFFLPRSPAANKERKWEGYHHF